MRNELERLAALAEHPRPIDEVRRVFEDGVERPGGTVSPPYFFGFIPTGTVSPSALADYLAAVVDKYRGKAG